MSLEDAFKQLFGREATDEDRQKILRAAQALNVRHNDAILLIMLLLESYNEQYSKVPEKIERAARASAKSAAEKAQEQINAAIASIVPAIKDSVKHAAKETIQTIQIGKSFITIYAAVLVIAIVASIAFLLGSEALKYAMQHNISASFFFSKMAAPIGLASALPALVEIGRGSLEDIQMSVHKQLALIFAVLIFIFLAYMALSFVI